MRAVEKDGNWDLKAVKGGFTIKSVRARELLRQIADAAWQSGDPGMQFDTTINDWNVCADTERVVASNPCGEYSFSFGFGVQLGQSQPHPVLEEWRV